jgi:hypothetical protein
MCDCEHFTEIQGMHMEQQGLFPASNVSWLGFLCDLLVSGTSNCIVGPIMLGTVKCVVGQIMYEGLTQRLVPFLLDWQNSLW